MIEQEPKVNKIVFQENPIKEPKNQPKKELKYFLEDIEKIYSERKQKLSLESFCFYTQEQHRFIAIGCGVNEKSYKRIFMGKKMGAKLLWKLQGEFINQEKFSKDRDYNIRDFILELFRITKFEKQKFIDIQVGKDVSKDCCIKSGIPIQKIIKFESFTMEKADKLNNIKGFPSKTFENFLLKNEIKLTFSIKRFLKGKNR